MKEKALKNLNYGISLDPEDKSLISEIK